MVERKIILDELNTRLDNIIKELECLEDYYQALEKLPEYELKKKEIIDELSTLYGFVDGKKVKVEGRLTVGMSNAYIEDTEGNKHSVIKKFIEVDVDNTNQYSIVYMYPSRDSKQNLRFGDLQQYNNMKARLMS